MSFWANPMFLGAGAKAVTVKDVFDIQLWAGNAADRTIAFDVAPDLVWIKNRGATADHIIGDTNRGANSALKSNSTAAASTATTLIKGLSGKNIDIGTGTEVNGSGNNIVGWGFKKRPKFFDAVLYTGTGVQHAEPHNLGADPGMILYKRSTGTADNWVVYHRSIGSGSAGFLNLTNAWAAGTGAIWGAAPTSTDFTVATNAITNGSGSNYVAYLFGHDTGPDGMVQCGSFVGNGSASGPTVNLGWTPQFVMLKNASATGDWTILDTTRGLGPGNDQRLLPNATTAESAADYLSLTGTGFTVATSVTNVNGNGNTIIYLAIRAE